MRADNRRAIALALAAARTSAYYAAAPFLGALLSFLLLGEALSAHYLPWR